MAMNKHRQDIAWCVPWAPSPAYDKKKGGGDNRAVLGNDGSRPDAVQGGSKAAKVERMRMATWNVGSMSRRSGEVVEVLVRRRIDFCCVQESRWKGSGTRLLGPQGNRFKFFYQGCVDGVHGVGILISERLVEQVAKVCRISERLMYVKLCFGGRIVNLVSAYAPQVGRSSKEKEDFWNLALTSLMSIPQNEMIILGGDLNGHVGKSPAGYEGIHGGFGYGSRNVEGEHVLEFCDALQLVLCNTFFKKEDNKVITYSSGGTASVIDYIAVRRRDRNTVVNVKAIASEECVSQHRLLVGEILFPRVKKMRRKFVPRIKVWKLKNPDVAAAFKQTVEEQAHEVDAVEGPEKWNAMSRVWLHAAERTCGKAKGPARHKETWWWSVDTELAVSRKRRLFRVWRKSRTAKDREAYMEAKKEAKTIIWRAQEAKRREFADQLERSDRGKHNFFRVAKQMAKEQQDVIGGCCIRDNSGDVVFDECGVKARWEEYTKVLLNTTNPYEDLAECEPVEGPCPRVDAREVEAAIKKMSADKGAGPSGVVSEMLKASLPLSVDWMTDVCNGLLDGHGIPEAWKFSTSIPLYKGKGDPLVCGSYRTIKLLEHGMKVAERVLEKRLRTVVAVDAMQFGFMPGKSTTDAIFIVRQMQEKHLAKDTDLFFAFVDIEKAFDRVPRKVVKWALRRAGVLERIVNAVMALFDGSRTAVRTRVGDSRSFHVNVGVHQGSVLSPLLFTVVMDQISRDIRCGLPWELLYADDLALMATSQEELERKLVRWKSTLALKGLKVNNSKTKIMICSSATTEVPAGGKWPCGVCGRSVGISSILCTLCGRWVHRKCSGVAGSLVTAAPNFQCTACKNPQPPALTSSCITMHDESYNTAQTFCYLGYTLSAAGGAYQAVTARIRSGWKKFHELAPFLTSRAPLKMKGRVYSACIRSAMTYGGETWAAKVDNISKLCRTENAMMRKICGSKLSDGKSTAELRQLLKVDIIDNVLRRARLRWFGHVTRKEETDWVRRSTEMDVRGRRSVGRPRKTWAQTVAEDMKSLGIDPSLAKDRAAWRQAIWRRPSNPV